MGDAKPGGASRPRPGSRNFLTTQQTLLSKSWLLKKRHWVAMLLEIFLPVLFILLTTALKALSDDAQVPAGWSSTASEKSYSLMQNGYLVQEPTLTGLMTYLGLRAAAELHNTTGVSADDQQACALSVGYGGLVSTDTSSAFSVLESCRNYVTPYKLAITPDNDFTRKYFLEAAKTWYPRVVVDATVGVTLPSLEDSVVFFDSEDALESYIGEVGYGKSSRLSTLCA